MKNTLKWIGIALLLVGLIVGATVLYNKLSAEYKGDNLVQDVTDAPQDTGSAEDTASGDETEEIKNTAPDFAVLDYEGNAVKLSDYYGKPIVLNFWATWCYYCKVEMPDFNEAYKLYPNVQFLMINATDGVSETVESAKKYIEDNGFEFDVFFDVNSQAVNAYGITGFPMTFFIDADGNLIARGNGMLDLETLERGIAMISE